jgi:restriction system protein
VTLIDATIWGIHGGRTGDADSLFLQHDCVALGWHEVGDLRNLPAERDAFKNRVGDVYRDWTPGKKINAASQLFRSVHEMKEGDLVCYPSKADRQIHIGRITGSYQFDSSLVSSYPNRRATKWLTSVPRTKLFSFWGQIASHIRETLRPHVVVIFGNVARFVIRRLQMGLRPEDSK